jgi:hypothetical protein
MTLGENAQLHKQIKYSHGIIDISSCGPPVFLEEQKQRVAVPVLLTHGSISFFATLQEDGRSVRFGSLGSVDSVRLGAFGTSRFARFGRFGSAPFGRICSVRFGSVNSVGSVGLVGLLVTKPSHPCVEQFTIT